MSAFTIVSFYAPRFNKWQNCDYDQLLDILDASCKRLGLRHVCISDKPRPRVETFLCELPENLMQAFFVGQIAWLKHEQGPTMFTGADCIITRDPSLVANGYDMAITTKHYTHINTGGVWCMSAACIPVLESALAMQPKSWGEDQTFLLQAIRKHPDLRLRELPTTDYNGKPQSETDRLDRPPLVVHFAGSRKHRMPVWWANWLNHIGETRAAA